MESIPEHLILIGYSQKPYGLFGEMKVRPETFDMERHSALHTVYFRKKETDVPVPLEVRSSRAHEDNWYLKFKGLTTPEAAAPFSGGMLFIPEAEKLELPENMVYVSELPGMIVEDENGKEIGTVKEVLEGGQELIVVSTPKKDFFIPWTDHFVRRIDKNTRRVTVNLSGLLGVL